MAPVAKAKRPRRPSPRSCLGPVSDLETHLPAEWWRKLFNALYVKTDGDVVENVENTRRDVDFIVAAAAVQPHSQILDLCCGQGRHCLELARRGFKNVTGVDRSRYLVRLAKKRAQAERLQVVFKEGDARNPRLPETSFDCVAIMGNSFGYFSNKQDDEKVLTAVGKILRPSGQLVLDITDGAYMADHFERRSWEWIDEHHFVCRERSLSGDRERLISREVIVHDELGVIADQFYAERLYTRESIGKLLEKTGFRNVRHHGNAEALSDRDQDLGMMARRLLLSADAPQLPARKKGKVQQLDVTVLMGDPRLPDTVKRGGTFNPEDMETIRRLKDALSELPNYKFRYLDNHATLERDLSELRTDLVFNLCDEGFNNDPFKELHVPAMLEALGIPYTGGGPSALAACYDKGLVRAVAMTLDVPVPLETHVRPGDQGATLPSVFPALLKPCYGDSSEGITKDAVVNNEKALLDYLEKLRVAFPKRPILVQEYLTGGEYSVTLDRQSRPGPARAADPRGRLLRGSIRQAAQDPGLRIEVGARQPLLDAGALPGGGAVRDPAAAARRAFDAAVRAARLPRLRALRFPRRRQGRDQAAGGQPQSGLVLGRQGQPDGGLCRHALLGAAGPDPGGGGGAPVDRRQGTRRRRPQVEAAQ